jgi:hypothetical protein
MKTLQDLKSELAAFTPDEQVAALCDGEFLAAFTVSEEEVNDLYFQILGEIES